MAPRPVAGIVVMLAVLAAGCGASTSSDADFKQQGEARCADQFAFFRSLPTLQQREALTITELRRRADEHSKAYVAAIKAMTPPAKRRAAYHQLVALLTHPNPTTTAAQLRTADLRVAAAYAAVGWTRCADLSRRAAASIPAH